MRLLERFRYLRKGKIEPATTQQHEPLVYEPLKPESKQIRLLFFPAADLDISLHRSKRIVCSLRTVDLNDKRSASDFCEHQIKLNGPEGYDDESTAEQIQARQQQYMCADCTRRQKTAKALRLNSPEQYIREIATDNKKFRFRWGDYIALSYVWGKSDGHHWISVNGSDVSVTKGLFTILQTMRVGLPPALGIWIDALAINQRDLVERAREVQKMGMIYSEALVVRAWIGMPRDRPDAIKALNATRDWLKGDIGSLNYAQLNEERGNRETFSDFASNLSIAKVLGMILAEPYWRRLWVLQEIILATSLVFWYGNWQYSKKDLYNLAVFWNGLKVHDDLASRVSKHLTRPFVHTNQANKLYVILDATGRNRESSGSGLYDLIALARRAQATDARDKVYGMLALLPNDITQKVQESISYSPESLPCDVYIRFTSACILSGTGLRTLAFCFTPGPSPSYLPSWVMDLDADKKHEQHQFVPVAEIDTAHHVSGELPAAIRFSEDGRVMFVQGAFVDELQTLAATADKTANKRDLMRASRSAKKTDRPLQELLANSPTTNDISKNSMFKRVSKQQDTHISHAPTQHAKLELARVLLWDSSYTFASGPSPLDIPWFGPSSEPVDFRSIAPYARLFRRDVRIELATLFYQNRDFRVMSARFREYFTASDWRGASVSDVSSILDGVLVALHKRQLGTTRRGCVGLVLGLRFFSALSLRLFSDLKMMVMYSLGRALWRAS
jgi:hypothetical protein